MVVDSYSVRRFLVDTGAEVSVFTATTVDRNSPCQVTKLTTANRSNICTFGKRTIPLQFNMRHFNWTFTIAQVSPSLLGANFLSAHSLLIDIKGRSLIDSFDLTSITLRRIYAAVPHLGSIASAEEDFAKLLADFQDARRPHSSTSSSSTEWSCSSSRLRHPPCTCTSATT